MKKTNGMETSNYIETTGTSKHTGMKKKREMKRKETGEWERVIKKKCDGAAISIQEVQCCERMFLPT